MRFRQMDGLRAAAALAVVMIHVSAGQTTDAELVWNQLSRFAVPMFLVLTGFGHAGALAEGKFEPQGWTAVRRRLSRVLPAYFLWSAAYLVLEVLCGAPHAHPLFDLLTGGAYVHLYYIFILVQFVLLADFFCIAMQRYPRRLMLCAAAATFGMQLLLACQANGMLMFHAPLSLVRLFFGWTLFYTGGIWLRLHEKWQRCPLCVSVPVWLLSALGVLLTNHMFPSLSASSLRPDLLVYVFATWLMLWTLCSRCRTLPSLVRFIARHSFGLYLAHPMVLRLWNVWTTHHDPVIYLRLPQMYLLGFGGGLAAAVLLSFLPFGTLLGGAHRKKRSRTGDL